MPFMLKIIKIDHLLNFIKGKKKEAQKKEAQIIEPTLQSIIEDLQTDPYIIEFDIIGVVLWYLVAFDEREAVEKMGLKIIEQNDEFRRIVKVKVAQYANTTDFMANAINDSASFEDTLEETEWDLVFDSQEKLRKQEATEFSDMVRQEKKQIEFTRVMDRKINQLKAHYASN